MQFKELKTNYLIYVLDKQNMVCDEAKVVSVSVPRFDNKIGQSPSMVVDVTMEYNGRNQTYVFPDNTSKAFNGNLVFCTDKADVVTDIKVIQRASEAVLNDIDKHKEIVDRCKALLVELDPEQKEKQKTEERFSALEKNIEETKGDLTQIKELLELIANK